MNLLFLRGIFLTVRNGSKSKKLHKEQTKETFNFLSTSDDQYNFCLL